MSNLTLSARLILESRQWAQGLTGAQGKMKSFVSGTKKEIDHLRSSLSSIPGVLAQIGIAFSAVDSLRKSAGLDESITRMGQNANATRAEIDGMRVALMRMAKDSGKEVEDLARGMDVLIAANLDPGASATVMSVINKEARITGAGVDTLSTALMAMNANFKINLKDGDAVTRMLEKMTVAGRQGNLELDALSSVIPRVAAPAKAAGMDDATMLAFLETLSEAQADPSQLATLAESTLRAFNNPQYRKKIAKTTGVSFTDKNDEVRPVEDVLTDLQKQYSKLTTGGQRQRFMGDVFGEMDITTQTGIQTMLNEGRLGSMANKKRAILDSQGQIARDYGDSMNNANAQSGVLKATLREATDEFSRPINSALTEAIKFTTSKDGLNMSGGEMMGYGAAGAAATYALTRGLPPMLQKAFGGTASLGTGAVMGNVLKDAGVATPVFIVGAAPGLFGGDTTGAVMDAVGGKGKGKGRWGKWGGIAAAGAATLPALFYSEFNDYGDVLANSEQNQRYMRMKRRGGGAPMAGSLDLNVHVKDDRVSVTVANASDVGTVRTHSSGPSTRYRRNTGRMMDRGDGR